MRVYDLYDNPSGNSLSPPEGTRSRALVRVGEHLAAYAQLPEAKRAEAEKALAAEADAVAARFKKAGGALAK